MCSMSLTVVVRLRSFWAEIRWPISCGRQAGVVPDDRDHRDVDLREDVGRHVEQRERRRQDDQHRHHDERVRALERQLDHRHRKRVPGCGKTTMIFRVDGPASAMSYRREPACPTRRTVRPEITSESDRTRRPPPSRENNHGHHHLPHHDTPTATGDDELDDGDAEAARAGRRRGAAHPAADRRGLDLRPQRADQGAADLGRRRRGADGPDRADGPVEQPLADGFGGSALAAGASAMAAIRDAALDLADSAQSMADDALESGQQARQRRERQPEQARLRRGRQRQQARVGGCRRRQQARRRGGRHRVGAPPTASPRRPSMRGRRFAIRRRRWSSASSRRSTRRRSTSRTIRRAPPSAWPLPAPSSPVCWR